MKEVAVTINGTRYKAKKLDDSFANFVLDNLHEAGISFERDNSPEQIFAAYLRLAGKVHNLEQELDDIIKEIES